MPTKEQLEETNDQLLAENRKLREQVDETRGATDYVRSLESESQRLREGLEKSESERRHAAQMLQSLSAAQSGMEQLFRTKEETSLQRLEIEARQVAQKSEACEKWRANLTTWRAQLDERDQDYNSKLKQSESQAHWLRQEQSAAQREIERYKGKQLDWAAERRTLEAEMGRLQALPGWVKVMRHVGAWLSDYPWFWVGMVGLYFLALMIWRVTSVVLDWMWPSSGPPPL
jgi:chromosome segregation ATPase